MLTQEEKSADKFSRAFADRYGVVWASLTPEQRDQWRKQVADLLRYIDSTAFRSLLSGTPQEEGN